PKLGGSWREYPGAALSADCSDSSGVGTVAVADGSGFCLACGLELQLVRLRSTTTTAIEMQDFHGRDDDMGSSFRAQETEPRKRLHSQLWCFKTAYMGDGTAACGILL